MKKVIKKKTQEEIIREQEEQTVLMRDFGYRTTDSKWEPFFVPLWEGGYATNSKCTMPASTFYEKFRAYCSTK